MMNQKDFFPGEPPGCMFDRKQTLSLLKGRVRSEGLTMLVGRPSSGKTWTLSALCRHLTSSTGYLVGYSLCTCEQDDLLQQATFDLYRRWMKDSSWKEQGSLKKRPIPWYKIFPAH